MHDLTRSMGGIAAAVAAAWLGAFAAAQAPFALSQWIQPVPAHSVLAEPGYYVWCGSVVEDGGSYHMFYSRWPTSPQSFGDGWLFASEICHAIAASPGGPFVPTGVVLGKRPNDPTFAFWDSQTQHNPHIRRFGAKFYLYYMASVDPGALVWPGITQRNRIQRNQRIGVIEANSMQDLLAGNFVRPNAPILTPVYSTSAATDRTTNPTDYASNRIVNNESVIERPDGSFQLIYKSNWPQAPSYGHGYALASHPAGPFTQMPPPIFSDQGREDENHWYDAVRAKYFLVCKNFGSGGTEQLESADSVNWVSQGLQFSRVIPWANGAPELVEALERPQLLRDAQGVPIMLYMAVRRAPGGGVVEAFNVHIPLRPPAGCATPLNGPSDVETTGTLVTAVNLGAVAPVALNGLTFAPSGASAASLAAWGFAQQGGASGAALNAGLVDTVWTGDPRFEDFLDTMAWQTGTTTAGATLSFQLTGLVPGHRYRCQLFFAESRTGTLSRHGPQAVRVDTEYVSGFDFGSTSSLVAAGAQAVRLSVPFTASAASVPVVLTQLVPNGAGLQLAAFAVHDVTATSTIHAPGCASSGGANTLAATSLPWIGATFQASGTGLPATALVVSATGVLTMPPLPMSVVFAQGVPGCSLVVTPDVLDVVATTTGTAQTAIAIPNSPAIVGMSFYHQMVPIEIDASWQWLAVTVTNALRLTVGAL
ncbi:MAG TPA: glycoside hydrolase family protein [Planctomycetota bacterium]